MFRVAVSCFSVMKGGSERFLTFAIGYFNEIFNCSTFEGPQLVC